MKNHALSRVGQAVGLAAAASICLGTACRHHEGFKKQYESMRANMVRGDWNAAVAQLEASKDEIYKEADRVMYWLNMATMLHYAGEHTRSNEYFVKAEEEMQTLWTTSVSSEASKLIVSESIQAYPGEDFEKILLYLYTALNHVRMGKTQDALVESRRADEFLKKMLVHYEKDGEVGTLYRQDAFILWLVGLFYEVEGSWNDAYLAYKAAFDAYETEYTGKFGTPPPAYVAEDVVRTAHLAGLKEEAERFKSSGKASGSTLDQVAAGAAEVILIHGNGEAPFKRELLIDGAMPDGYVMRIALPEFVEVTRRIAYAEVTAGGTTSRTVLAEPITSIALKNFEHRLPAVKARAIARAAIKYAATKGAEAAAGGDSTLAGALVGFAGNVASAASEAADLRAWTTLPAEIGVTRLWLPAGTHTLEVMYQDASGQPVPPPQSISVELGAGERRIVSVRTFY